MTDKIIIRNYTDKDDYTIFNYISNIIKDGKVSENKFDNTYCFITKWVNGITVSCDRRNNTYTFCIYKEDDTK